MNVFIGIGKICDVNLNGRLLKFNLAINQEKPCSVPCVLFDPDKDIKTNMEQFEESRTLIWVQGKSSTYEFDSNGKTIKKIEIMVHPSNIRPI